MCPERSVTYVSGPDRKELEPRVGVEPTTCRLRIDCSTTELPRPLIIKDLLPCQTHFRPAAIKLPSPLPKSALCSPTHNRLSPARREQPNDIRLAILAIRWEERLLSF